MKAHCVNDEKGVKYFFDAKKGYFNGLVILANSMYSKPGKSAQETRHVATKIITHPEFVSIMYLKMTL